MISMCGFLHGFWDLIQTLLHTQQAFYQLNHLSCPQGHLFFPLSKSCGFGHGRSYVFSLEEEKKEYQSLGQVHPVIQFWAKHFSNDHLVCIQRQRWGGSDAWAQAAKEVVTLLRQKCPTFPSCSLTGHLQTQVKSRCCQQKNPLSPWNVI